MKNNVERENEKQLQVQLPSHLVTQFCHVTARDWVSLASWYYVYERLTLGMTMWYIQNVDR